MRFGERTFGEKRGLNGVKKGGLGRGLDSLFSENAGENESSVLLRISEIEPNREQPRNDFNDDALNELAESIRLHGVLQPLLVRPMPNGRYRIVAGERRWRACRIAGEETVPAIIREMSDGEAAELTLIENLQREDLSPLEEAEGYRTLAEKFGMTQEQIAQRVSKSRPAVANAMRLLSLTDEEKEALSAKKISVGHAKALLAIENPDLRRRALAMSISGATVRSIENVRSEDRQTESGRAAEQSTGNRLYKEVCLALRAELGRNIKITEKAKGGTLQIDFYSDEELCDIAQRLAGRN